VTFTHAFLKLLNIYFMATVSKKILWGSSSTDYITVTMDDAVQDQIIKVDSTDNPSSSARSKSVILSTSSDSSVTASLNVMQAAGALPVGMALEIRPVDSANSLKGRNVYIKLYNQTRGKTYKTSVLYPLDSTTGQYILQNATSIFESVSVVDGDIIYVEIYSEGNVILGSSKSKPTTVDISVSNQVCQYAQMFDIYRLDLTNTLDMAVSLYDQYGYQSPTTIESGEMNMFNLVYSDAIEYIELDPVLEDVGRTVQLVVGPNTAEIVVSSHVLDEGYQEWLIPQTDIVNALDATGAQVVELRYLSYHNRIVNFMVQGFYSTDGISASAPVPSGCTVTLNYMNVDGKSITVTDTTDSQGYCAFRRADVAKVSQQVVVTVTPPLLEAEKGTTTLSINATVIRVAFEVMCKYVVS
jgi:hypothetical protein